MKILIVLDEIGRVRDVGGGLAVSGNWWRPGKDHDVIRVHGRKGAASVMGGPIVKREVMESGRTLVWFEPDQKQIGHPYPEGGVRQNGCLTIVD